MRPRFVEQTLRLVSVAGLVFMGLVSSVQAEPAPTPTPTATPAPTPSPTPAAELNTEKFSGLETDRPAIRDKFVREQNRSTHARLAKSSNYRPIQKWLKELYEKPQVKNEVALNKKSRLKLVDRGLGKPTELVLVRAGYEEVLFSSNYFRRNNSVTFVDFQVSPDQSRVAMAFAISGSIDEAKIVVYNLGRREIDAPVITASRTDFAWFSPREILIRQIQSDGTDQAVKFNLVTRKAAVMIGASKIEHTADTLLYVDGRDQFKVRNLRPGAAWQEIKVANGCRNVIGIDQNYAYLLCMGNAQLGEVRAFAVSGKDADKSGRLLVAESDQPVRKTYFAGQSLILMLRQGAARKLRMYDTSAIPADATAALPLQHEIVVPNCCSVAGISWEVPGAKLRVTLVSALQDKTTFIYDVKSSSWEKDPAATMLTAEGVKYKTEILDVISNDGSHVPLRVTMREDAKADGTHPAFFFTYGGFKNPSWLDPNYRAPFIEFMRRGGILATPGIRGGDEFGPEWHQQATRKKKINTFYDLSASAKLLIDQGWTVAPKVISAGGSNGGLTVAATGLLFPENFGLIVPYVGVLDTLGKDRLDSRFEGWSWEYGSASEDEMKEPLKAISPLELVSRQGSVRYLVFTGLNDSRVNTAHSLKFVAAMKEHGTNPALVDLVALKNAGHWMSKESYQNWIGWYCDVVLWTTVFDQVGWTW